MQEQKKYHQRKLAIIEMYNECDKRIAREQYNLEQVYDGSFLNAIKNSKDNIKKYHNLRHYLTERYNRQ